MSNKKPPTETPVRKLFDPEKEAALITVLDLEEDEEPQPKERKMASYSYECKNPTCGYEVSYAVSKGECIKCPQCGKQQMWIQR